MIEDVFSVSFLQFMMATTKDTQCIIESSLEEEANYREQIDLARNQDMIVSQGKV